MQQLRSVRFGMGVGLISGVAALGLAWTLGSVEAASRDVSIGKASYVEGQLLRARSEPKSFGRIMQGAKLFEGDTIKTKTNSRCEVKLRDGSMLRLGADSQLQLKDLDFDRQNPRRQKKVRTKLFFGRVWASVTSLFGRQSSFEVETPNAVAGVRGTRFAATTSNGGDTTVRVYSGKVLVSNEPIYKVAGATRENRQEVAGPQEIDKEQWEKLIAEAMQQIRVAADGQMGAAESFSMGATVADTAWEKWNAQRDAAAGFED